MTTTSNAPEQVTTRVLKNDLLEELRPEGAVFVETHISWVYLVGDDVYKVKKPVDFGFLDFSTVEKRRAACQAEVHLNRRLAPHVYHACVPITRDAAGRHHLDGSGETVDWAVHMVRLPEADRADVRLEEGRLDADDVEGMAIRLARFHAEARSDEETASYGDPEVIEKNIRENFEQTRDVLDAYLSPDQADEVEAWQLDFLARKKELLETRQSGGRVRDGHGDLRLEHVYLDADERVTVIDCIEFSQRLRFGDVAADIAFLAMDLTWYGRVDLAERFLAAYARESGDYDLYPLVDFYESYRAFVRGKIASLMVADPEVDAAARERAESEARRYFLLSLASERRFLAPPWVIAVGGVIASGKSTLARAIGAELSIPVIESDLTRKQLLDLDPTEKVHEEPWQGAYSPQFTEKVYEEVFRRADAVLRSGRSVVLDASFRTPELRAAARWLARDDGVSFVFVECRADREVCFERLKHREHQEEATDGRREIFDDFVSRFEPAEELEDDELLVFESVPSSERPFSESVAELMERLAKLAPRKWPPVLS